MDLFINKKIILFGSGARSIPIVDFFKNRGLPIHYMIDNDQTKWNSLYPHDEIEIHSPNELLKENKDEILIVIASSYYTEMKLQLTEMNFIEHKHFIDGIVAMNYQRHFEVSLKRTEVVHFPFGVFNIELTNKCPMKCMMCARTHGMTREQGFMTFEIFQAVIDELSAKNPDYGRNHDLWLHHFGESLLHPEFDAFIRYAVEHHIRAALSVNPIMLTEETSRKLLLAKPYRIYLSLDGHDDESFFQIRGVNHAYERSKDHVRRFLQLKKELHSDVIVVLSMIDFEINKNSVNTMKGYWSEMDGIDEFLAKPFVSWNGDIEAINRYENPGPYKSKAFVSCNIPWETVTITWDGDVVPCCYDYDKKLVLGNVSNQSIEAIWNGSTMQKLRREFINNQVTNPLCKNCTSLYAIPSFEYEVR